MYAHTAAEGIEKERRRKRGRDPTVNCHFCRRNFSHMKLVILTKKTLAVTLEHQNTPMMSCVKMIVQVLQSGLQLRGSQLVAKEEKNNVSD